HRNPPPSRRRSIHSRTGVSKEAVLPALPHPPTDRHWANASQVLASCPVDRIGNTLPIRQLLSRHQGLPRTDHSGRNQKIVQRSSGSFPVLRSCPLPHRGSLMRQDPPRSPK